MDASAASTPCGLLCSWARWPQPRVGFSVGRAGRPRLEATLGGHAGRPRWEATLGGRAWRPRKKNTLGGHAGKPRESAGLGLPALPLVAEIFSATFSAEPCRAPSNPATLIHECGAIGTYTRGRSRPVQLGSKIYWPWFNLTFSSSSIVCLTHSSSYCFVFSKSRL